MTAKDVRLGGGLRLAELETLEQDAEPLRALGVIPGRVETRHVRVADELHQRTDGSAAGTLCRTSSNPACEVAEAPGI